MGKGAAFLQNGSSLHFVRSNGDASNDCRRHPDNTSTHALMKRFFALITIALISFGSLRAAEANWLTNYDQAAKQAVAENKPLVMDFTGSDWCGWCIKLDKEVFAQPEFINYAKDNLVLLKLDFPRKKQLPAAEKAQNEKLSQKFGIEGFPTIVVLDPKGKKLGEMGYEKGGAKSWIASLEKVTKK
jgi:protein disulfide-isomerase